MFSISHQCLLSSWICLFWIFHLTITIPTFLGCVCAWICFNCWGMSKFYTVYGWIYSLVNMHWDFSSLMATEVASLFVITAVAIPVFTVFLLLVLLRGLLEWNCWVVCWSLSFWGTPNLGAEPQVTVPLAVQRLLNFHIFQLFFSLVKTLQLNPDLNSDQSSFCIFFLIGPGAKPNNHS